MTHSHVTFVCEEQLVLHPYDSRDGSAVPMNIYNTWPGFHAETLPPVQDAKVVYLVHPILDHLRILLIDLKCFDLRRIHTWDMTFEGIGGQTFF